MRPVVLCFSGLDPSGGAGLQADIEAIAALQAHATIACTALTIQDSQQVYGFQTVDADLLAQQAAKVLADLPVKAIKCGMLGTKETVDVVKQICQQYPHIPLVLDPVLAANSGGSLTQNGFIDYVKSLFAFAQVITPNTVEAERLTGFSVADNEAQVIKTLHELGAKSVLLKGGHEQGQMLRNRLYQDNKLVQTSHWPRLNAQFHGSGCSLASAIAAGMAHDLALPIAVTRAEVWLQRSLQDADFPHVNGQGIPRRI